MDFGFTEEQQEFRDTVRSWVEREVPKDRARDYEAQEFEYPFELWDKMSKAGFHAVGLPEEYDGQGGDVVTQMILARELARSLAGLTWIWGISSFCAKSVAKFGSESLKATLIPKLAVGDIRIAISLTEPSGGTDVLGAMRTTATKVDGGWRINGQKIWSTAAHVSQYLMLVARTDPNAAKPARGVTIFLVPNPSEGLEVRQIPKVGMRSVGSCEVFLDDVFVPDCQVVGEVDQGWYQMLQTLNNERIMVAALCTGVLDGVIEDAVAYLGQRTAFGKPIGQFQVLQHYLADMVMWRKQAELVTYEAAWRQEQGLPCGVESTMAKVIASEHAGRAADLGLQMLGGMGYALETNMQRYWRDVRLYRIGPITSEMARNVVAESFGMPRSF
jgi:alkylation response protein AidB-like acyl-CoA dehydrogenase